MLRMPPKPRPGGKRKRAAGTHPPTPQGAGPGRRGLIGLALAGAVVVVGLAGLYLVGGGDDAIAADDARAALTAAGCRLQEVEALPFNQHTLQPGESSDQWNTDPPTSGPHYQQTAIYGAYTEPLDQARVVHNLEHGAVFIQYGKDVPAATVAQLRGFYDARQSGTLLAPLPRLDEKVALGAWTFSGGKGTAYLATCTTFHEAAFAAFFDAFQFHGPERFDPGSMLPGRS